MGKTQLRLKKGVREFVAEREKTAAEKELQQAAEKRKGDTAQKDGAAAETGKKEEGTHRGTATENKAGMAKKSESAAEKQGQRPIMAVKVPSGKSYEEMTVEELQAAVLAKMAANGPVTDEMYRTVEENIWHDSLVNWVRSFR